MSRFKQKNPVYVEATQWFKNGDHPEDYVGDIEDYAVHGDPTAHVWTAEFRKANDWEGEVVRYFRSPSRKKARFSMCKKCNNTLRVHGWLDEGDEGFMVCPGDWIVTSDNGYLVPMHPSLFHKWYDPVETAKGE